VFIAGQIGWNNQSVFETDDFVWQVRQALVNVVAVLAEAGGTPAQIARMTWYITDKAEYRAAMRDVGRVYREVIGAALSGDDSRAGRRPPRKTARRSRSKQQQSSPATK